MKMYLSTAIFLSMFIVGFSYFCANFISDNFYTKLYPLINDYFWAKTILFVVSDLVIAALGFLTIFAKFFPQSNSGKK